MDTKNDRRSQMIELTNNCPLGKRVDGCPFNQVAGKPKSIKKIWLELLNEQNMQNFHDFCDKCFKTHSDAK